MTVHGLPWRVDAVSYTKPPMAKMDLYGIDLVAPAAACSVTLDGTAAGANDGYTNVNYDNTSGTWTFGPGGDLRSWAVSKCLGVINSGDDQRVSGPSTVVPEQDITSPYPRPTVMAGEMAAIMIAAAG